MCRLMLWTRPAPTPTAYDRGDCVDILNDNQFDGIEVIARDWFRMVSVPGYPNERFAALLETPDMGPGWKGPRRLRGLNLSALEAIGRKAKGLELSAMDQIVILAPAIIDTLTFVKRAEPRHFMLR